MKSRLIVIVFLLLITFSCDRIVEDPAPIINRSGTDMLSFCLTDGTNTYPSFIISDTAIFVSVPNQGDFHRLRAVFTHNGSEVCISGVPQKSNDTVNDYSDFTHPLTYTVTSDKGETKKYSLYLFDIPVVIVNTQDGAPIDSKEEWLKANMVILDTDGTKLLDAKISIKGRGNGSWTSESYPKKSYSVKFDKKAEVMGMPSSKRWVLLGTAADYTKLRTPICFRLSELLGYDWCPSGNNVEFILNGKILCNYFLCEQIRAEKNRISIQEMTPADTTGVNMTGGVLFEVSEEFDEEYKFRSSYFNLPFMLKSPNDSVLDIQMAYFQSFVNQLEETLYDEDLLRQNLYLNFLSPDSYVKWWLVNNICMNREVLYNAKNFYMYKERGYDMKLTAGPPWDFDWGTFWSSLSEQWIAKDQYWFAKLFSNSFFVERVKYIWNDVKYNLEGDIDSLVSERKEYNRNSVVRDQNLYPVFNSNEENGMQYDEAIDYIVSVYKNRLKWLDAHLNELN